MIAVFIVLIVIWKTRIEYRHDLYNVDIALKYVDTFFIAMKQERVDAAECLFANLNSFGDINKLREDLGSKELKEELEPIDNVLDILDDLGFLLMGAIRSAIE
jgi:hypothetical protein